jgi:hypothetical protein
LTDARRGAPAEPRSDGIRQEDADDGRGNEQNCFPSARTGCHESRSRAISAETPSHAEQACAGRMQR